MPVRCIICKSRRAGLSTGVSSLIYDDTVSHANTKSLIVANERNPSENVLGMYTLFWRKTPTSVRFGDTVIKIRPDLPPQFNNNPPKDRLVLAEPLSSAIYVASARSLDAYLSFGFQNIHATEASRYADSQELFRALGPTLSKDQHSALYIESTPNGQSGRGAWFYEQCLDAQKRKNTQYGEMKLVFIPWHEMTYSFSRPFENDDKKRAFERSLKPVELGLLKRFPYIRLEQLLWRRSTLAAPEFNQDEDTFDQEYPTDLATAFLMSGTSVFGRKAIKRLMSTSVRPPIWSGDVYWGDSSAANEGAAIHNTVRRPKFLTHGEALASRFESHANEGTFNNLKVWRWPKPGEEIIISCDVGGGRPNSKDGDFSTVCVGVLNELDQDELIMTWRARINPIAFAEVISALAWAIRYRVGEHAKAPLLAPEWNGPGTATCTYIDDKNLYPNLYRYQVPGVHGMPRTKHIGWESNAKTKRLAVNYCLRMVDRDLIDIPDEELVLEMSSYRQTDDFGDDASYSGAAGKHDDLVSAFQILCALLRIESKTLPGETIPDEVDDAVYDEDVPAWGFYDAPVAPMPGTYQSDPESDEESLFWSGY